MYKQHCSSVIIKLKNQSASILAFCLFFFLFFFVTSFLNLHVFILVTVNMYIPYQFYQSIDFKVKG